MDRELVLVIDLADSITSWWHVVCVSVMCIVKFVLTKQILKR